MTAAVAVPAAAAPAADPAAAVDLAAAAAPATTVNIYCIHTMHHCIDCVLAGCCTALQDCCWTGRQVPAADPVYRCRPPLPGHQRLPTGRGRAGRLLPPCAPTLQTLHQHCCAASHEPSTASCQYSEYCCHLQIGSPSPSARLSVNTRAGGGR